MGRLVPGRLLCAIDNQHIDWASLGDQLQAELLLNRSEKGGANRIFPDASGQLLPAPGRKLAARSLVVDDQVKPVRQQRLHEYLLG
jgi:hypothetical protein